MVKYCGRGEISLGIPGSHWGGYVFRIPAELTSPWPYWDCLPPFDLLYSAKATYLKGKERVIIDLCWPIFDEFNGSKNTCRPRVGITAGLCPAKHWRGDRVTNIRKLSHIYFTPNFTHNGTKIYTTQHTALQRTGCCAALCQSLRSHARTHTLAHYLGHWEVSQISTFKGTPKWP